jgi:hypothetical protein
LLIQTQAQDIFDPTDIAGSTWDVQSAVERARDSFVANHIAIVENIKVVHGVESLDPGYLELRNVRNQFAHDWKTPRGIISTVQCTILESTYNKKLPEIVRCARMYAAALRDPSRWTEPETPPEFEDEAGEARDDDWGPVRQADSYGPLEAVHDIPVDMHLGQISCDDWFELQENSRSEDDNDDTYPERPKPFKLSRRIKRKIHLHVGIVTIAKTKLHPILLRATLKRIPSKKPRCLSRNGLHFMKSHRGSYKTLKALTGPHDFFSAFDDPSLETDQDYLNTITALHKLETTNSGSAGPGQLGVMCGSAFVSVREWEYIKFGEKSRFERGWRWMMWGPWTKEACRAERDSGEEEESDGGFGNEWC